MADRDKRDPRREKGDKVEFEDLGALKEDDWSSALDEWDAAFSTDGAGVAAPSPAPEPGAAGGEAPGRKPPAGVAGQVVQPVAGAKVSEAPTPVPGAVAPAPAPRAQLSEAPTPVPGAVAPAPAPRAQLSEAPTPVPSTSPPPGDQALPLPPLESASEASGGVAQPLVDADFELHLDQSEALGQMLGSMAPPDLLEDIPGAVMDGPPPDVSPFLGDLQTPGLDERASAGSTERQSGAAEFEESTRMVSADDQLRLAREAMQEDELSGSSEFEESTRIVAAEDQLQLLTKALDEAVEAVEAPRELGEVAPEESLTVDSDFYDSIDIAGEGVAGGVVAQDDPGPGISEASGDRAAEEVTPIPGGIVSPRAPDREREAALSSSASSPDSIGGAEDARPLVAELDDYDEDSGLGSLDALLGLQGGVAPPPTPGRSGPPGLPPSIPRPEPPAAPEHAAPASVEALDLPMEAGVGPGGLSPDRSTTELPSGGRAGLDPEIVSERQGGPAEATSTSPAPDALPASVGAASKTAPETASQAGSKTAGSELDSLDALLGTDPKAASAGGQELSSLDTLLGLGGQASVAAVVGSGQTPISAGGPPTRLGWSLPDPPRSRRLGALAAGARQETFPQVLPSLDFLPAAAPSPSVEGLAETVAYQAPPEAAVRAVVGWCEHEAQTSEEAPLSSALEAAAGILLEVMLEDVEGAQPHYVEAVARDGSNLPARRGQLRCALGAGDWGAALEALEALREGAKGMEHSAYHALAADLSLATMGDTERAQASYEALSGAVGVTGLLGLCDVAVAQGDNSLLASGLRRLSEAIRSDALAAPLALEAGRRLEVLEEDEQADVCFARATEDGGEVGHSAREGRARIAHRRKDWPVVAERLRSVVTLRSPGMARTDAAARLQRVLRWRLDRREEAFVVAEAAAREAPEDLAATLRMVCVAEATGHHAEAASAWDQAASLTRSAELAGVFLCFAGERRERFLGEPEGAAASYQAAVERAPTLFLPSLMLGELMARSQAPARRVEAWIERARSAHEENERDAAWSMAARELVRQERPGEALARLSEAVAQGASGRAVLRELATLQASSGDPVAAGASLLELASRVEPELAAALRHRAALLKARAGEGERRVAYAEVIEADEGLGALRWALQRAIRAAGDAVAWEAALAAEAGSMASPGRASRLWRLIGWGRLWRGEPEAAKEPLERALGLDPTDLFSRTSLLRLAASGGDWGEVARLEAELAEQGLGPRARALWTVRRAVCLENRLDRADEAAELYRSLGAAHPGWEVPRESLLRLRRWAGDRHQVATALQADATVATSPELRAAKLVLAASELDLAGEPDAAALLLAEAASLVPSDPMVRVLYDAVEVELGNWATLADRALVAMDRATDDKARAAAYEALAAVDRDGRDDMPSAILAYESLLRMGSAAGWVLRELELFYPVEKRFDDLARVAHQLAETTTGTDRAAHAIEWARLRGDAGDLEGMTAGFRMALEGDPESIAILTRLEVLTRQEGRHEELARIYEAVSRHFSSEQRSRAVFLMRAAEAAFAAGDQSKARRLLGESSAATPHYLPPVEERLRLALLAEDWAEAAEAAETRADASAQTVVKVASRLLAGVLAEDRLQDDARALRNYQAVLELELGHEGAFDRLRALLRRQEHWTELARLLTAHLDVIEGYPGATDLLWELALLERDHLRDPTAAKITLRRLIALDERRLDAVQAATALFQDDDQHAEMAEMLIRQARLEQDPAALIRVFFRLGELYNTRIPDPKRAIASFTRVLQLDPGNVPALERISAIQLDQEDWKSSLAVTGRLLEVDTRTERRIEHLLTLARILEQGYRDPRRAREALIKALEINPLDLRAVGELAEFYQRQNDRRSLMVHLDRTVTVVRGKLVGDPFEADHYLSLARLFEWRKAADQRVCAAAALVALGHATTREKEILASAGRLSPRIEAIAEPELDEALFPASANSGFRHTFRIMGALLERPFRADLGAFGASRTTRLSKVGDPLRDHAAQIASRMGVSAFELHVIAAHPNLVAVEPGDPPVVLLGSAVVENASEAERAFVLGRCLKIIQSQMILPIKLEPARLRGLVAGIVRQYIEDFEPREVPAVELLEQTRIVAKQLSRKLKGELMPFAYECAGITDYENLSSDLAHMANRAGLLCSGDLSAAVRVLLREAGRPQVSAWAESPLAAAARGVASVEHLLVYAVSEEYFELRGRVGLT